MRAEAAEFLRELDDLDKILKRIEIEQQILGIDLDALPEDARMLLLSLRTAVEPFSLRRANYSMVVVVLYSSFERFVDRLIYRTVADLSDLVPTFDDLPEPIRTGHRKKTLEALTDETWLDRQGDPNLPMQLIEYLHSCEARLKKYQLNAAAYARHTANYRVASISRTFQELGVTNFTASVAQTPEFKSYLSESDRERGLFDSSLGAVDDLASRRNDVAHGNASDLISPKDLHARVEFFRVLTASYVSILRSHLTRFAVAHNGLRIGPVDKVHYKKVVIVDLDNLPSGTLLRRGDSIAMQPAGPQEAFTSGRIQELRTDYGTVDSVFAAAGSRAAIELDFRPRPDRHLFLLSAANPCPWISDNSPL